MNFTNLKKHLKRIIWKNSVQFVFGFDAKHLSLSHSNWTFTTWIKDEVPYIAECQARVQDNPKLAVGDGSRLQETIDKLYSEMQSTSKKTTPLIQQMQIIQGKHISRLLAFPPVDKVPNILTSAGMTDMAKRSTEESSLHNTHHAIGTGTTTESLNDHTTYGGTLQTEQARKVIGTRSVVNQTERYGIAFVDTDIAPPKDITEAGIFTSMSNAICILRVKSDPQLLDSGKIITVQTNISHQNGTEV